MLAVRNNSGPFWLVFLTIAVFAFPALGQDTPVVSLDEDRSEEYFLTVDGERLHFERAYALYRDDKIRERHYWRALLETGILQGFGIAWYFANQNFNAKDWDFDNTEEAIKRKFLTLEQIRFDNNSFLFNNVYHPVSYFGIYIFSRANNLSVLEAYFYTFFSSLLWEYVGELREKVSINDQIVSPFAGMAFGEVGYQFGEFFHSPESSGNIPAKILTGVFGIPRGLHDWIDDVEPRPGAVPYEREWWHRFSANFGINGIKATGESTRESPEFAADLSIDTKLVSMPGYLQPGRFDVSFSDGNFTDFEFRTVIGDEALHELAIYAESSFYGYYTQQIAERPDGRHGWAFKIAGARAYEIIYRNHSILTDELAFVHVGPSADLQLFQSGLHLQIGLRAFLDFATVRSHAWPKYLEEFGPQGIQSTLVQQSYYFGVGPTLIPRLSIEFGGVELGTRMRWGYFTGIQALDRREERVTRRPALNDRVLDYRFWLEVPTGLDWLRGELLYERITRRSRVGEFQARKGYRQLVLRANYIF